MLPFEPRTTERAAGAAATQFARRDFLALAATAAASGLPSLAQGAIPPEALSVGFLADVQRAPALRSAHALTTGDAAFLRRGVRLSVLGLGGAGSPDLQSLTLLTHASLPGLAAPIDVVHWGMRASPVACMACASNQVVALDEDGALRISLELRHKFQSSKQTLHLDLSTGWRPGVAKLQPGTYLLAFDFKRSAPDWGRQHAAKAANGARVEVATNEFSYLVLEAAFAA